jgi:hypothetical protein
MHEVTQILSAIEQGAPQAADQLLAVRKGGLAPGYSLPGLNLILRVGCLSPFPDSLLLPLIYDELRKLAVAQMAQENPE